MANFENVDLFEVLGNVVNENTEYYKSDFEHDKNYLAKVVNSADPEDKIFYWLSRSHGTHLLNEREVFIKTAPEHNTFTYWHEVKEPSIRAYAVVVKSETDGKILGDVYELDYPELCEFVKTNAVVADRKKMHYENGSVEVAENNYENLTSHSDYGRYVGYELLPNDPENLTELLKKVRAERGQETQAEIEHAQEEQPQADESVFSQLPPEKQDELRETVKDTMQFLIEQDLKVHGEITEGTQEALKTQGYTVQDGVAVRIEDITPSLSEQENAADSAGAETPQESAATVTLYHPINEAMARRAKEMNSYSDYRQGSATASYRAEVDRAVEIAERQKKRVDPQYHDKIDGLLATYCRKLAANINKGLEIETRCPSWLVSGGSNFPVRKKEKQNAARDTNFREYQDIQGLLDKIRSVGMGGISADDPNAIKRLEKKLADLTAHHEKVKGVNAYFRKHKTVEGCPLLTAEEIEKMTAMINDKNTLYKMPYPPYELPYSNRAIRDVKQRIESLKKRDSTHFVGWEFEGGKVEPNTTENRLQIFFEEKPSAEARNELKENGFNWSPKAKVWQRQLKSNLYWICDKIECIKPLGDKKPTELLKEANAPQAEQQTETPLKKSDSFIGKLLDSADIEVTHFTSQEQFNKWVAENGEPKRPEQTETAFDVFKEPTLTITLTESNRFEVGQQMPFSTAVELFSKYDSLSVAENDIYKVSYTIEFVLNGEKQSYEGRNDLGGKVDLLSGIKNAHEYLLLPDIQQQFAKMGQERLEQVNEQCDFILNTFIPYMELHNSLSTMEKAAKELAETSDTPEKDNLYYCAVSDYVSECRQLINNADLKTVTLPEAPKREDFHKPTMDELEKRAEQGEQIVLTDMIDSINADKKREKAAKSAKDKKSSIVKRLADEKAKASKKAAETPKRTTNKKHNLEVD